MADARYNVRVTFINGNSITLDCRGCGQIYLEPNHDYYFENAPIKFINYLAQLRRVGISYKMTADKRGCYRTFNLAKYEENDPRTLMNKIRAKKIVEKQEVVKEPVITEEITDKEKDKEIEEPKSTDVTDQTIINESDDNETPNKDDEVIEGNKPEITEEPENVSDEVVNDESETKETNGSEEQADDPEKEVNEEVDLESMSKKELIDYAHSLGLNDISDIYTKKEIRNAINNLNN